VAAVLVLAAAGSLMAAALAAPQSKTPGAASAPAVVTALPDGPGRELVERDCMTCHSSMLITQQAKDSTGWEKTIGLMEKWGSPVKGAEHDTLRTYLLEHFGPKLR
jgi:cytochrome c5